MKHLSEEQLIEYIAGGEKDADIREHLRTSAESFRLYQDILELNYDAARPLNDEARARIAEAVRIGTGDSSTGEKRGDGRPRHRRVFAYAAAGVLLSLGVALGILLTGTIAPREAHRLTASIGDCEILERRTGFASEKGNRELKSGPFSVCEITYSGHYRLRLLQGILRVPHEPARSSYELKQGRLIVERVSKQRLTIRLDKLEARFHGTKAVLDRQELTIKVIHGEVRVAGPGIAEEARIGAGRKLETGKVVRMDPDEEKQLGRLFQKLPAKASKEAMRKILPEMYPGKALLPRRLFLKDGRVLEGLVSQQGDVFTILLGQKTLKIRKSEITRIAFPR